ncbi:hypothetical protein [Streptomyces alboflavus]|uniref:hypothetical protein n=1 Tax=Streptomyces alboflavus TaxID=67267 RepID=UPI0036761819
MPQAKELRPEGSAVRLRQGGVMTSPLEWTPTVGEAVYDRGTGLPWKIKCLNGQRVTLVRPSGLEVVANRLSVRPATPWQKRQLKALANFHKQRMLAAEIQRRKESSL